MLAVDVPSDLRDEEPTTADERVTARERRRQRVRAEERRQLPMKAVKTFAVWGGILVGSAGVVWGLVYLSGLGEDCALEELHEHATFYVYDNGTRVRFQHPKFDMEGPGEAGLLPSKVHMHQPNDYQVHLEFGCATMGQFFGYMGAEFEEGRFQLDDVVNGGKVLEDEGNMTLRYFLFMPDEDRSKHNGTWIEKPDLPSHQGRDCQRMLITFGELTDAMIAEQQKSVPAPTDSAC